MSTRFEIPAANQSGFTLKGLLVNAAWKGLADLSGWTAKISLLTLPSLSVATQCNRLAATLDLASFDPVAGSVPISFALAGLGGTPMPVGEYRVRWILIDPNTKELGGPPSRESTVYAFTA